MSSNINIKVQVELSEAQKQINKLRGEVSKLTTDMKKNGGSYKDNKAQMDSVTKSAGALSSQLKTLALAYVSMEGAKKLVSTISDLEDGFVAVAKTTGFAGDEMEAFKEDLKDLSSELKGVSILELQSISETAGQLGISGSKDILKFTEAVAMISVATDLSAKVASVSFAKLSNVLDEPIGQVERMGSVVNALSDNSNAIAEDLTELTIRIGGTTRAFGLSTAEAFAFSATLKDIGATSEAGGTAIKQLLGRMLSDTDKFAKASGVSLEAYTQMIKDKPVEAVKLFLAELNKLDKFEKYEKFKELGIAGEELKTVVLKLAGAQDKLNKNLKTANDEWRDNISLQNEYEIASKSLSSLQKDFANEITLLADAIGKELLPVLKELVIDSTEWIKSLDKTAIGDFVKGIVKLGKAISVLNDIGMPDILGGKDSTILSKTAEGWGYITDAVLKFGRAVGDEFDDAVISSSQSFKKLNDEVNSFDGNSEEFKKLEDAIKDVVYENDAFIAQMMSDDSEYYKDKIDDLTASNKNLVSVYKILNDKKPHEKAIKNTKDATKANEELESSLDDIKKGYEDQKKTLDYTATLHTNDLNTKADAITNKNRKINYDATQDTTKLDQQANAEEDKKREIEFHGYVDTTKVASEADAEENKKRELKFEALVEKATLDADALAIENEERKATFKAELDVQVFNGEVEQEVAEKKEKFFNAVLDKREMEAQVQIEETTQRLMSFRAEVDMLQVDTKTQEYELKTRTLKFGTEVDDASVKKSVSSIESKKATIIVDGDTTALDADVKKATGGKHVAKIIIDPVDNVSPEIERLKNPTDSIHTINPDTVAVDATFNRLNNTQTHSTHTIHEYIQKHYTSGGAVRKLAGGGGVRKLPHGGAVDNFLANGGFPRLSDNVPGHDLTGRDDVPAMLTEGEFIQNVKAVDHYGANFMRSLNSMKIDKSKLPKFASGGFVAPKGFSTGGDVVGQASSSPSKTVNVNLNIGDKSFEMISDEAVANQLASYLERSTF